MLRVKAARSIAALSFQDTPFPMAPPVNTEGVAMLADAFDPREGESCVDAVGVVVFISVKVSKGVVE